MAELRRPGRRAVTREQVEDAEAEAELAETIAYLIENDDQIRAAILRLVAASRPTRKPRPTLVPPRRTGRGT